MGKPRYNASVDANQARIVRDLNDIPGVVALVIEQPVDILVGYNAHNFLFEIKDGNKKDYEHKYTGKQKEFLKGWPGQVYVAKCFDDITDILFKAYGGQ